jgi:hypothetical protein
MLEFANFTDVFCINYLINIRLINVVEFLSTEFFVEKYIFFY